MSAERYILGVGAAWLAREGATLTVRGTVPEILGSVESVGFRSGLFSVRGGDEAGATLAQHLTTARIDDLSSTFLDRATPVENDDGNRDPAFGLFEFALPKQLRRRSFRDAAARAAAVVVDCSLPEAAFSRALDATQAPVIGVETGVGDPVRLLMHANRFAALVFAEATARQVLDVRPRGSLGALRGALQERQIACPLLAVNQAVSYRLNGAEATLLPGGSVAEHAVRVLLEMLR